MSRDRNSQTEISRDRNGPDRNGQSQGRNQRIFSMEGQNDVNLLLYLTNTCFWKFRGVQLPDFPPSGCGPGQNQSAWPNWADRNVANPSQLASAGKRADMNELQAHHNLWDTSGECFRAYSFPNLYKWPSRLSCNANTLIFWWYSPTYVRSKYTWFTKHY